MQNEGGWEMGDLPDRWIDVLEIVPINFSQHSQTVCSTLKNTLASGQLFRLH